MRFSYVLLSEVTLPRTLWLAVLRKPICIVGITPIVSPSRPVLDGIARRLQAANRAQSLFDLVPELVDWHGLTKKTWYRNMFARVEGWVNDRFDFHRLAFLGQSLPAYRHVVCNYVLRLLPSVLALEHLDRRHSDGLAELYCMDPIISEVSAAFLQRPLKMRITTIRAVGVVIKSLLLLAAGFQVIFTALTRIRLRPPSPTSIKLGGDTAGFDARDLRVWKDLVDNNDDIMLVLRNRRERDRLTGDWARLRHCLTSDGHLSPSQAAAAIREAAVTLWAIRPLAFRLPPDLFLSVLMIPVRRIRIRALLQKYRFECFWSRDEYNVEHILRSQELRRYQGISLGVTPGPPVGAIIAPMLQYIDYDFYYMNSRLQYEKYYKPTWPPHMQVRIIGSLGLTPERRAKIHAPRPKDFVFLAKPGDDVDILAHHLNALAKSFADRTIHVRVKADFIGRSATDRFMRLGVVGNDNVRISENEDLYDLFLKTTYAVSDPSSAAAEAISFGLAAYVIDTGERESLIFRDFPGLCVSDPEELVCRFKDLDEGKMEYPRQSFAGLTDITARLLRDMVREDLGLPPHPDAAGVSALQRTATHG